MLNVTVYLNLGFIMGQVIEMVHTEMQRVLNAKFFSSSMVNSSLNVVDILSPTVQGSISAIVSSCALRIILFSFCLYQGCSTSCINTTSSVHTSWTKKFTLHNLTYISRLMTLHNVYVTCRFILYRTEHASNSRVNFFYQKQSFLQNMDIEAVDGSTVEEASEDE